MRYSILAVVIGILFIVLGVFFPINLNCEFLAGGGNQSCGPMIIEQPFTLTLESVLVLIWGSAMLILGVLVLYDKI
jgi:hypothetical protein